MGKHKDSIVSQSRVLCGKEKKHDECFLSYYRKQKLDSRMNWRKKLKLNLTAKLFYVRKCLSLSCLSHHLPAGIFPINLLVWCRAEGESDQDGFRPEAGLHQLLEERLADAERLRPRPHSLGAAAGRARHRRQSDRRAREAGAGG